MKALFSTLLILAGAFAGGCNSGNPVAPEEGNGGGGGGGNTGTFTVTVTAEPAELIATSAAPSTLTITARRQDNGQNAPDGTQVAVSVDRGSLGVASSTAPVRLTTLTLSGGRAQVSYFGGTEVGTATVLATVGSSIGRTNVAVVAEAPAVFFLTDVQPNIGQSLGGDVVTIRGSGFKRPLRVQFGGVVAQVMDVPSPNRILVTTPPPVTPPLPGTSLAVDVLVTNALDQPSPPSDTLPGGFFYREDAPPVPDPVFLTAVNPRSGNPQGGDFVVLTGGGFRSPLRVEFGGRAAVVSRVTANRIEATTPSSPQPVGAGATLPVDVRVVSGLDSATPLEATLPLGFLYDGGPEPGRVVVTSISPSDGPHTGGTVVTVTGQGFEAPVAVELGGVRQSGETVVSSRELRFTTAALAVASCPAGGVQTVTGVTVTNLGSSTSGSGPLLLFRYHVPLPRVRRISPTVGPQLGNTVVSIEGESFEAPLRVVFAKGEQQFAGVVQGTPTATLVRASSPRVPDSLFPEQDCVTGDNRVGKRFVNVTVDIVVTNLGAGCTDTFGNAFTIQPTITSCRPLTPPPP